MFEATFVLFFIISLLIALFFYTFITKNWNYFIERNVKFERGWPLLGSFYPAMLGKMSIGEISANIYNKYPGDKFLGIYEMGGKPSYMIRDPELIKTISVRDFDYFMNHFLQFDKKMDPLLGRALFATKDQKWRDLRSILSPLFTGSKMRTMLSLMNETIDEFNDYVREQIIEKSPKNGLEFNFMDLLTCLTNDVIGSCAFGFEINSLRDRDNDFYTIGTKLAYAVVGIKTFVSSTMPNVAKFFRLQVLTEEHNNFFRKVIRQNVEYREKNNIVRNDMIHLLLLAKEGKLNTETDEPELQDTGFATISEVIAAKTSEKLKNWTEDDIVSQCIVFFVAGFTAVATSLCFLCHEMAVNSDIQERLYQEILQTHENLNGERVKFEDLQKMTYLDMVVSEVLRLWPIALLNDRRVSKQYVLENSDGTKVVLQPDDIVWMPTFAIHRDPKYYSEPLKFDPERFSDVNKANIHPGTYAPFGLGPRACIASRFALMQLKSTIFHMLLEFKIECSAQTQIPIKTKPTVNALTPERGFWLQLKLR